MNRLEETLLIARCVAGDSRSAFGKLVEANQEGLRRFLLGLTGGNAPLADDLAQESFIKAYTAIGSFRGGSRFSTWLYSIAYREFLTDRRTAVPVSGDMAEAESMADAGASADSAMSACHDVNVALASLTPAERSVTVLFYLEDRPIKEISAITGLPEGTVKVYLSRARKKMATCLQNDEMK